VYTIAKSKLIEIVPVAIAKFLIGETQLQTRKELSMAYSFVGLHVHLRKHGITWNTPAYDQ